MKSFLSKRFDTELAKYSCHPKTVKFSVLSINLEFLPIAFDFTAEGAKLYRALDQKRVILTLYAHFDSY